MKRVGSGESGRRSAEKAAEELRARLVLGKLDLRPNRASSASYPFTAYAREWFAREVSDPVERGEEHALSPRSRDLQAFNLRAYLQPFFGDRDVRELRPADVAALRDSMLAKGLVIDVNYSCRSCCLTDRCYQPSSSGSHPGSD